MAQSEGDERCAHTTRDPDDHAGWFSMMIGHVVVYDDALWVYAGSIDTPAAYAGGPSHSSCELAPFDNTGAPTQRRYVQDPKPESIRMLPGCSNCGAASGWRCQPDCETGTAARA